MFFVEEISLDAAVVVALSELDIFTLKEGNIMTLKTLAKLSGAVTGV